MILYLISSGTPGLRIVFSRLSRQVLTLVLALGLLLPTSYGQSAIYSSQSLHHPVLGEQGMVASQHYLATEVGLEILQEGGNAVDAAVGVGFALAVVLPRAGNIGGGGFMLVHDAGSGETKAINYREKAPLAAGPDMYLDEKGELIQGLSGDSYLATGVPGTVAGLLMAHEKYGVLSRKKVMAPAIRLAKKGFPVSEDLSGLLKYYEERLKQWPATRAIFFKPDGTYYERGDILIQNDLSRTLKAISKKGSEAFYQGDFAEKLVADMASNSGMIVQDDLDGYRAEEIDVIWGKYKGYDIASMPPPSSGGIHLIQILKILEDYPLKEWGHNSTETIHIMAETMKLAYADRSEHLGDPYFWDVPQDELISNAYAEHLRKSIVRGTVRPSTEIGPGNPRDFESDQTTHFTVVDGQGNVVSNTYTLNYSFGLGAVVPGTGVMLNNEMDDFSAKPGAANAFGLIGGEANKVEPGKRPLSSMTPTIVFKDGKPFLATGSPGGSRIITTVLQLLLNVLEHDMNVAEATHQIRLHHQWLPDLLYHEKGLNADTMAKLMEMGYELQLRDVMGSTQSILIKDGVLQGASDPRTPDAATRGY